MNYYISTGLNIYILWEEPNEPYRDASKQEIPWNIPKPPNYLISNDSSPIEWVRHKHIMKDELDQYYFTILNSEDIDISWTTPSEAWRDAKYNESLVTTPERPGYRSNVVPNNSKAEKPGFFIKIIISTERKDKGVKQNVKQSGLDIQLKSLTIPHIFPIVTRIDFQK